MSFYHNRRSMPRLSTPRFRLILSSFLQHDGLPFSDALPEAQIERAFVEEDALFAQDEDAIYTPAITLPDTPENQAAYPQSRRQKPGVGFPIARMVVLFSLATAMVCGMAMGPYAGKETGETALLRQLFDQLDEGDILLADRYYCSYFMIALLRELGIDFVVRMHQLRKTDFRRGRCLARDDHLVRWTRPQRPSWMDEETYERMPGFIEVREVRVRTFATKRSQSLPRLSTQRGTRRMTSRNCIKKGGWRNSIYAR